MRLHTLERAMEVLVPTTPGKGLCFHWSAAILHDVDYPGAELCIAILHTDLIHAWVEFEGNVYAPTLIEKMNGLVPIPKPLYYRENMVRNVKRLTREQVLSLDAYEHLTTGKPLGPGRALGDELMTMAGIRWKTTEAGTAVAI